MPRLMSHFSGNQPTTYGTGAMSTHRSGNWDEATLGAPGEDPEYGAGNPERVLALVPGGGFQYGRKAWKGAAPGEKNLGQITKTTSVTEFSEHQSQEQIRGAGAQQGESSSESSSPLRK